MSEQRLPTALLAKGERQEVLKRLILPAWTQGAVPQERPVVVFVAGQPGAGKTEIGDLVQAALEQRGGAVRIGRDLYKAAHPDYGTLLAQDVRTAGVRVRPETVWWQAEVEAYVRGRRLDAVVETALADPDEFRAEALAYREANYRVEVVALATQEALSQLGLVDRFLDNGQFVSWSNHDSCAAGMPRTLGVIESEGLADRVVVVRRGMVALYSNDLVRGVWLRPVAAERVVVADRARWWSARETAWFRRKLTGAEVRLGQAQVEEDRRLAVRRDTERAAALAEPVRRIAQSRLDPPGVDYHRLSSEEHAWIFDELIVPSFGEITAQEQPVVVYVMAQPGAGKTNGARLVRRALRERRPTQISGDDFKTAHPDYLQLLREEPRTAGQRIRGDYRAWQIRAEAWVRERRGDVVIEMAPAGPEQFLASAEPFHKAGYRVEVVVLAARAADSRQGTFTRYAQAGRGGLPARLTTAAGHQLCFDVLPATAEAAEEVAHSLTVLRRDGSALYRNGSDAGTFPGHRNGVQALVGEQLRPYTEEEANAFLALQRELRRALPQYRSELGEITSLAWPLMPAHVQPRRLPGPTVTPVPALPARRPASTAG